MKKNVHTIFHCRQYDLSENEGLEAKKSKFPK
jgi:hypothetical protein